MAIAFDAAASATTTAVTSLTYSHTCTGTSLILIVAAFCNQSNTITGVTYNGNAMTNVNTSINSTDRIGLYYTLGPATGAHNVVISISGSSSGLSGNSESFTGVKQSAQPDASTTAAQSATPKTTSLTVVAANSWCVVAGRDSGSGGTTASTNCTDRGMSTAQVGMFDSGGPVAAGSFGMTMTSPASMFTTMMSFSPDSNAFSQTVSEALALTDAATKTPTKVIADSTTNTDTVATNFVITRVLSETLALTDSVLRTAGKSILETLALTDTTARSVGKVILDALAMAAADVVTATKVTNVALMDTLNMAADDVVATVATLHRTISDSISVTDSVLARSLWAPRTKPTSIWTPRGK